MKYIEKKKLKKTAIRIQTHAKLPHAAQAAISNSQTAGPDNASGHAAISQRTTRQSNRYIWKFYQFRTDGIRHRRKNLTQIVWMEPIIEGPLIHALCPYDVDD